MIVSKGTKCHPSIKGYYNFFYPDFDKTYELTMSIEVKRLAWIGFGGHTAFEIISPQGHLPMKVLWIRSDSPV
ncbi:MAG TPA: hypothetical protein EYN67_09255 [Flavobacteriales bacterium]|nr:hypothetical protein [Flavobacteriales bacterium]